MAAHGARTRQCIYTLHDFFTILVSHCYLQAMTTLSMFRLSSLPTLLLLIGSELNAQRATTPATFQANAQMVLVPVTVTDHYGKTIEGLRAKDFNVLDDRKPQQIVSFTIEDAPCSLGLVLDVSGSMHSTLGAAKDIAHAFFGTTNPDDEFQLLTVSTVPASLDGFTTDVAGLEKNIEFARPGGMTALIDTVYLGLSRMREAKRSRRGLLILSDGIDNNSRRSQKELMRVALEADVQVYTIIMDGGPGASSKAIPYRPAMIRKSWDRPQENQGPEMLEKLADKTGGLHFRVRNAAEAKDAVIRVGRALRNEYVIGYQPPTSGTSGKLHRVHVKPNVPNVNVYARNGYYSH
jgi:Ca-activated chloride channel family protein